MELPGSTGVPAFVQTAIAAGKIMLVVVGVDPECMVVDMLVPFAHRGPGFASVCRPYVADIH